MLKILVVLVAVSSAVYGYDEPAITTQHQNILRSYGNLGQISAYSKTLDTPYSSVRKADVRISNPGLTIASPLSHSIGVPSQPIGIQTFGHPLGLQALSPQISYSQGIASPLLHGSYPGYAAHRPIVQYGHGPVLTPGLTKTVVPGALGVAYSPSTAVSHMTFTNGLGLNYAW